VKIGGSVRSEFVLGRIGSPLPISPIVPIARRLRHAQRTWPAQQCKDTRQPQQDKNEGGQGQRDRYRKTKKQVLAHVILRSEALNLPPSRVPRLSDLNNLLRNFCVATKRQAKKRLTHQTKFT
jgi:hypothetical protein